MVARPIVASMGAIHCFGPKRLNLWRIGYDWRVRDRGGCGGIVLLNTKDLESEDVAVARQALKQERCLLYVSATRARDRLFVSGHRPRSPLMGVGSNHE